MSLRGSEIFRKFERKKIIKYLEFFLRISIHDLYFSIVSLRGSETFKRFNKRKIDAQEVRL